MAFFGTPELKPNNSAQVEAMKKKVSEMQGIDRYNPTNLSTLEQYVQLQCQENFYDLEANLSVLKLYQFNPQEAKMEVIAQILLKALSNLPHTDFVLCKCLIDLNTWEKSSVKEIMQLHREAEQCEFQKVWARIRSLRETESVVGFDDAIRFYIGTCVNMTYQQIEKKMLLDFLNVKENKDLKFWMDKFDWRARGVNDILIANHEENIKTRSILEIIDFESVEEIMAAHR